MKELDKAKELIDSKKDYLKRIIEPILKELSNEIGSSDIQINYYRNYEKVNSSQILEINQSIEIDISI